MMDGYEPVDLADRCNAGPEAIEGFPSIESGPRIYLGLPFRIGRDGDPDAPRFILLEPGEEVVVPIGRPAERVIVAHRRLPPPDGSARPPVGGVVASYVFEPEGGDPVVAAIRERFEIGSVELEGWDADSPFLAAGAGTTEPMGRYDGRWEEVGLRQTEIPFRRYMSEGFLWVWQNPDPSVPLKAVRLQAEAGRVLVLAITLSNAGEPPFLRDAAVPVRVRLNGARWAGRADELSVQVDRGVVSNAYPLPADDLHSYLADPLSGWGQAADAETPYAYVRMAALPSATVTMTGGDDEIARFRWSDIHPNGLAADGVVVELVEHGRNWVHVTVLDDETGRPVPCRIHFRSLEGVPYQPYGHHDHVNSDQGTWHIDVGGDVRLGRITYAYIDGTCQGWLPTGDVIVDVARGFEVEPLRRQIRIEPGQRELVLRLRRMTSMNERGWYSGDSHVHFLSAQGALTEQQGEDLNVVNLLQSQWGSLFTNTEDFIGAPHATPDGRYVTYVSQENRQHFLGHLVLWGLRRPIMPWCTDGLAEAEVGGSLEVTESEWADRCHEQGGTVVIPHFPRPNGEPAVLVATGRADAIEMIVQRRPFHEEWYRYLNTGYRLPLVGGTDKMSSQVPVGLYRTYAQLADEAFDHDSWCRAVRQGRTFLSGGPLIAFTVDGHGIGDTVAISGPGTVTVSASVESIFPVSTLEIVQNGRVIASIAEDEGARRLQLTTDIRVDGDRWLAARCGGPGHFDGLAHRDIWERRVFAHTSPVYVTTGDEWRMFDAEHARYMQAVVEGSLAYIRERSTQHRSELVSHHHGETDHMRYLERPFLEALAMVRARLNGRGE
jgi:hypothetical protein